MLSFTYVQTNVQTRTQSLQLTRASQITADGRLGPVDTHFLNKFTIGFENNCEVNKNQIIVEKY